MVLTPLPTLSVYEVVPEPKAGFSVPELMVRPVRLSSVAGRALVTITVYVSLLVVSCASTTTAIVLAPALRLIAPEDVPLVTGTPLTVI